MAMAEYKLGRRNPECAATGQPFTEGEEIVSAIFEGEDGFERRDYKASAFTGDEGAYSFWRAHIPVKEEDEQKLDYDLALDFFVKLVRENEPERAGLRFVLGLLLGRKRRLKLKGFRRKGAVEFLDVVVRGDEEDEALSIEVPDLDEEARAALQAELNRLFGIEVPEPEPEDSAASADSSESGSAAEATGPVDPAASEDDAASETRS
jgi:hypothetical protein